MIRRFDGTWFVDDEDEFAEHQVSYGYPAEVVAAAEAECARVADEIRSGAAVFRRGDCGAIGAPSSSGCRGIGPGCPDRATAGPLLGENRPRPGTPSTATPCLATDAKGSWRPRRPGLLH